jgi:hypothetical protein
MALKVGGSLRNRNNKICSLALWDSDLRKTVLMMSRKKKTENYRPDLSPHITESVTV